MRPPSPPPLSGKFLPARICSRDMDWPNGKACGREPFLHCAWSVDAEGCEAGFVCEEHAAELTHKDWIPVQQHEMASECGMPGAVWDFDENRCYLPEEEAVVVQASGAALSGSSSGETRAAA
jgi:hypothetical protein